MRLELVGVGRCGRRLGRLRRARLGNGELVERSGARNAPRCPRGPILALARVVRSAKQRGVAELRRPHDRLERSEVVERRCEAGAQQVPRGGYCTADDETFGGEGPEPRLQHVPERRRDLVECRDGTFVSATRTARDLLDVDLGNAVALDQRGPGDGPLDR